MQFDFTGQSVLITGASRGIGRVVAEQFAASGARVIVHYNTNREAAESTRDSLHGDGHIILQANTANPDDLQRLSQAAIADMGRIDVLVNNAGIYEEHPVTDVDFAGWLDAWQRTININLMGSAHLSYLIGQHMIAQGGGRIVNVTSRGAFRGEPTAPAYGASKAAMNAMSQSLAKALAPHGVFVHAVAPGFVETDMAKEILESPRGDEIRAQSPLNRVALPEEVARTILFLAARGTEFLTGCVVDVNGASYLRT